VTATSVKCVYIYTVYIYVCVCVCVMSIRELYVTVLSSLLHNHDFNNVIPVKKTWSLPLKLVVFVLHIIEV
jgi:hypothetical protein